VLAIPFLFRGWDPGGGLGTAVVFALTSVIVGLREELLYRAVLINLLQPRVGLHGAICLSTVVFLLYHYGALPLAALPAIEVVCMSLLLGIIYAYSGSLLFVIALHSLYDGIWFFGPYTTAPLPDIWRLPFLLSGLALIVLWASRMPSFSWSGRAEARRST
jgi:membrane protease YdiL (CAAX protease family)